MMQIIRNNSKSIEPRTWLKLNFKPIYLTFPTAEVFLRPEHVSQCGRQGLMFTSYSHWPCNPFQKLPHIISNFKMSNMKGEVANTKFVSLDMSTLTYIKFQMRVKVLKSSPGCSA